MGAAMKMIALIDYGSGNLHSAARAVRVQLTLPTGWFIAEFHGEELSENPSEVDPQHLAPNDAMIFHQIVSTCDQAATGDEQLEVTAHYQDPVTRQPRTTIFRHGCFELFRQIASSPESMSQFSITTSSQPSRSIPSLL